MNNLPYTSPRVSLVVTIALMIVFNIIGYAIAIKASYAVGFFIGSISIAIGFLVLYNRAMRMQGYNAYYAGVPIESNPKTRGWNEYYEWNIGWKYAQKEDEEKVNENGS